MAANFSLHAAKYHYYSKKWNTEPIKNHRNVFQTLPTFFDGSNSTSLGFFLQKLTEKFEKTQTNAFSLTVPLMKQLILSRSPQVMKAVFSTQVNDFNLGVRRPAFGPLLGNGIFASEGRQWKHSRTLLKPQFAREQVGHVKMLEPHVQMLARQIQKSGGEMVDMELMFYGFTLDAATHFLFGESVDVLKEDVKQWGAGFDQSLGFVGSYLAKRLSLFDFYWMANSRQFRQSIRSIHDYTNRFVDKALALKPEEIEERSKKGYIFLYELVKRTRNPVEIRDELLNILIAGRATTAALLLAALMELAQNPEIWRKLRSEVFMYFGKGETLEEIDSITFESLKKCTYLKWVVNETLRLWPPVPLNLREAVKDTTLPAGGGLNGKAPVFIPKGTIIVVMLFCIHRLEEFYGPDANAFSPERWERLSKIGWAFMPFGSGPRICLGQQFALTEVLYVLVRLAQMFETLESGIGEYPPKTFGQRCVEVYGGRESEGDVGEMKEEREK